MLNVHLKGCSMLKMTTFLKNLFEKHDSHGQHLLVQLRYWEDLFILFRILGYMNNRPKINSQSDQHSAKNRFSEESNWDFSQQPASYLKLVLFVIEVSIRWIPEAVLPFRMISLCIFFLLLLLHLFQPGVLSSCQADHADLQEETGKVGKKNKKTKKQISSISNNVMTLFRISQLGSDYWLDKYLYSHSSKDNTYLPEKCDVRWFNLIEI